MNARETRVQGLGGIGKRYALAVQQDFALIRRQNAAENIHQRGFAGTVFAQKSTNLPGAQFELNICENIIGAEGLVDLFH